MKSLQSTTFFTVLLLLITVLHHGYGAIVYHTPWRLHVAFIALPVAALVLVLHHYCSRRSTALLYTLYLLSVLLFPLLAIGLFEGAYNHLVKNIVWWFTGPSAAFNRLFPSPMYEVPDNAGFEITGVLQAFVFAPLAFYFTRLVREKWHLKWR